MPLPCNLPMALFIDMQEVQNTLVMFMDIRNKSKLPLLILLSEAKHAERH